MPTGVSGTVQLTVFWVSVVGEAKVTPEAIVPLKLLPSVAYFTFTESIRPCLCKVMS